MTGGRVDVEPTATGTAMPIAAVHRGRTGAGLIGMFARAGMVFPELSHSRTVRETLTDIATIGEAFATAELWHIIVLSLSVSMSAAAIAAVLGLPLGVILAIGRFRGRRTAIVAANSFLGLPPVVIGLALYLLLSHTGSLGFLGLLFTPTAMVIAQAVLAVPIVVALAHRAAEELWAEYGDALQVFGASKIRAIPTLLSMGRGPMLTAVLAGFGRTISEVGAILIVGGNIAGYTRTMTTTVALETSKGNLPLALGLGLILIGLSTLISATAFALLGRSPR